MICKAYLWFGIFKKEKSNDRYGKRWNQQKQTEDNQSKNPDITYHIHI